MNLPPYVMDLRIEPDDGKPFRLWLPLFLLWPLLLVLGVLALVLTILADLVLWAVGQRYHYYTLFLIGLFGLTTKLSGTTVRVRNIDANVDFVIK